LSKRGYNIASFKVGPDFIDPGHHAKITGKVSRNLDGWMLSKQYNIKCFNKYSSKADIAVIEGVMGLFDGYDGKSESGSTAQMAKWLGLPVILSVDAKSMARSAAALVKGFEEFDKDLFFAGVIFNNVGSKKHLAYLQEALKENVKMPCIGGIANNRDICIPERHLGLVTTQEHALSNENINKLADTIEKSIDLKMFVKMLPDIPYTDLTDNSKNKKQDDSLALNCLLKKKVRIGVAMDKAFCFYYQDNLDLLCQSGAELVFFSPVKENSLPEEIDGLYFGGGYPEIFAKELAEKVDLHSQIRKKCLDDMPIYSECGGFIYLCKSLFDQNGNKHPMAGCFPFNAKMSSSLRSLGYREIRLLKNSVIGSKGEIIRGHEFHYSLLEDFVKNAGMETIYSVADKIGDKAIANGYKINQCLGSYIHLHFGSNMDSARHFVKACQTYRYERISL